MKHKSIFYAHYIFYFQSYGVQDNSNKTGNIRVPHDSGTFVQTLLRWTINEYYYSTSLLALVIQHAMRMRHIFICALSTLPHKGHDFRGGGVTEHKIFLSISLHILSPTYLILRNVQRYIINVQNSF
jgi:hypothetical protein